MREDLPLPATRATMSSLQPYLHLLPGLRRWYATAFMLAMLTAAATLGLLALSGWFISAAAVAGLLPQTAQAFNYFLPGAGVRALALTRTVGRWGERVITHEATFRMLARLRVWLLGRLLPLTPRQLGVLHGAELLHRFMRDVEQLDGLLPRILLPLLTLIAVLGCGVWLLSAWGAWGYPLVLLAVACALPVVAWILGRSSAIMLGERRALLRRALIDAADGVGILAFNARAWGACRSHALACAEAAMAAQARHDRLAACLRAGSMVTVGGVAWWALIGHADALNGPVLVALVLLLLGVSEIAAPLAGGLLELPAMAHAAGRIESLASQRPAIEFPASGPRPVDGRLLIDGVCFGWDAHTPVLKNFSLTVGAREHVFLSGPSGCGKSTLVQLLARFEVPSAGRILIGGTPLEALDEATLRRTLAVATQFAWARGATLADNLRLAAPGVEASTMWAALDAVGLADTVRAWPDGLDTWVTEGGQSLSGGQLRRLGMARALLRRAPLTVLDEPTEGLDEVEAERMAERVCDWLRGETLIWISHRPEGGRHFQRIVSME
jgi:ATP-binding cassette subfamily C protein CydC